LVGLACPKPWALPRTSHIGGMVITRRLGFSNDQWLMEGINLLQLRYTQAGIFRADSSQIVRMEGCRGWTVSMALAALPRDRFDYAWLVDTGPYDPQLVEGMQPVWRGPGSILYRLNP
jgi:hypothetical protein